MMHGVKIVEGSVSVARLCHQHLAPPQWDKAQERETERESPEYKGKPGCYSGGGGGLKRHKGGGGTRFNIDLQKQNKHF